MFIEIFQREIADEIRKIAEEKLSDPAQFIVDVVVTSKRGPKKILVILDGDTGITIDDCANLNRELSKELDGLPQLQESYLLEVSTPGLNQPLKLKRQYKKNIGRRLSVKLAEKTLEGKLVEVTDDSITIEQGTGTGKQKQVEQRSFVENGKKSNFDSCNRSSDFYLSLFMILNTCYPFLRICF